MSCPTSDTETYPYQQQPKDRCLTGLFFNILLCSFALFKTSPCRFPLWTNVKGQSPPRAPPAAGLTGRLLLESAWHGIPTGKREIILHPMCCNAQVGNDKIRLSSGPHRITTSALSFVQAAKRGRLSNFMGDAGPICGFLCAGRATEATTKIIL